MSSQSGSPPFVVVVVVVVGVVVVVVVEEVVRIAVASVTIATAIGLCVLAVVVLVRV